MPKKVFVLILALIMAVALLSTTAFVAAATQPAGELMTEGAPADTDDAESPDDTYTNAPDAEIAPLSIAPDAANADKVKKYFVDNNFVGTYVTGRDEADYSNAHWSIKIDETGDVALLYDGEDTGATATFNNATTGKPGAIVFSRDDWESEAGDTKQVLTVTLDGTNGYFTMPKDYKIYWDKDGDGERENYSFSDAAHYYNETILKDYFKENNYAGVYTLPDGSGWKVTVGEDGGLTMSSDDEGADNAFIDYMTMNSDHKTVKTVIFASPDWWNNSSTRKAQTLTLTWTTQVTNSTYNHKSFKCAAATLYNADGKTLIKGFTTNSYFIADNGIFSYEYFKDYAGTYALSTEYGNTYDSNIEGIGGWYIEIDKNGHVYLHVGEERYEAVMTSGATINKIPRVNEMYVALPGWYTNSSHTTPAYITLTWGYDEVSKSAGYGKGALYFTTAAITKAYKQGDSKQIHIIPALRFEREDLTNFAKSKLATYTGEYLVSDGTEEKIAIEADGTVKLHIKDGEELTPLYYTVDNTNWREDDPGGSAVTSVVFSKADWFAEKNKKAPNAERATVTMTWDPASLQFAVSSDVTCYAENSEDVIRIYSTAIKYSRKEGIDEGLAYMYQYVKGEYTLNDGSGWKISVNGETGDIYTKFDTDDYEKVANPAPTFAQNTDKTIGNEGKYLDTITVTVPGWYLDEGCTQEAVVKLTWNGKVVNPMDDHQFTVTGTALYRKVGGETECKYLAGTFYSDADRKLGEKFLKSLNVAGTYHPTEAAGKWWIDIAEDGKVTVSATDSQGNERSITDVAMDLTMDKKDNKQNFGNITAVTDIKVVVPEWRTAKTNDTLANIMQCGEVKFTFTRDQTYAASSYFTPSNTYIYADTNDGTPWEVVTKSSAAGYNKPLITKIYDNDRAYSDDNKAAAREYFQKYPGTYYIDDPSLGYQLTVTDEGDIYWGDLTSLEEPLPADVQFDVIRDDNGDGKVNEGETEIIPGTISVWLNGYTTGKVSSSVNYNDGTQRADFTWKETILENETPDTAHTFKTSKSAKGYKVGATVQTTFAADKSYARGENAAPEGFVFAADGTYETTDGNYRIEIKTEDGVTSYNFYRPDVKTEYPLKLFGSGDKAYLRGKIGMMKKADVYLVVTKILTPGYENFLFTAYEVTYNDLNGKSTTSSGAPTVTIPAMTRFTNYAEEDTGEIKNIIVAEPGENVATGEPYSRLSLALHSLHGGETIYLKDDIEIDFAAKLPDGVGEVTIDGQGHTITRGSYVKASTILLDPEISLMALDDAGDTGTPEHYTGAILQIGEGDTVTLKNVTIDGEGNWEWDNAKLEYDKQLNQDYDIDVLDTTKYPLAGHPIKELPGNVTSTESLIKVNGGTLKLDGVTLQNFFAGDGYDDDRHFIDFMSKEGGKLEILSNTVFQHNASRSGVCIGNTDQDEIYLNGWYDEYAEGKHPDKDDIRPNDYTIMQDNYCYGGNGGLVVAMEGTQVYMEDGTKIINNVAADTNGTFIQLHKKDDGVKDGDNKGTIYSKLHMNGGYIHNNVGLRGGSYGWGNTVYLYNGGAFTMNGGEISYNMGAGISSIYQQPSADALQLIAGHIHHNTCSLQDEGTDWALDIALMNKGTIGPEMIVEQNYVVGAAAILGGYASGDEYLTNDGEIHGNISVYSYFNNEGNVSTVVNNNLIEGDIRLENGSFVKNGETGTIIGNITVRGALTESAGESSFHNEGNIEGNVELAENAHMYNSGDITGNVTVKSGGVLEMNCNEGDGKHGGTVYGDVTVYPGGVLRTDGNVETAVVEGTIYLEYEDDADLARMLDVLNGSGIAYHNLEKKQHEHSVFDETIEPEDDYKCTDPWTIQYTCQTCGKVVDTAEIPAKGEHEFYLSSTKEATCTEGAIESYRCNNCSAYNSTIKELKVQVSDPLGHKYVELEQLYIPPTEYASGHLYYICERCGKLLEFEINSVKEGAHNHTFQNDDGSLNEAAGVRTEPTCTDPGKITFTCADDCGTTIEIEIPAKGHRYPLAVDDYIEDCEKVGSAESTCTTAGYIKYAPKCTACGKPSETYTYQVNLPKLGHLLSDWEDVNEGEKYFCTTEREQIRYCTRADCDDYEGSIETRLGGMTNHTWDDDHVTCTVCGYVSNGHRIEYMTNGGIAPKSLKDIEETAYTPGNTETLWLPKKGETETPDGYWTKQTATGQAVFVGWSATDPGAVPFETNPTEADTKVEFISSVVIPEDQNALVYAVWAVDRNKNGTADYDETPVSIVYDANGGEGDLPESLTGVLPGAKYPLETAPNLKKGDDVFAGWSETEETRVVAKDGPRDLVESLVTSPYTVPASPSGIVTLYAVYATDSNANGIPDYCEGTVHVEYYINGGQVHKGYTVVAGGDKAGMFYVCNDYHEPDTAAALLAVEYGTEMIYHEHAVLAGWSATQHEELVTSEEEAVGLLITEVNIPKDATENSRVYAVWAADENNNYIADYTESKLSHTYYNNQYLSHGSGSALPLGQHLNVTKTVPERQTNILPGMGVELAANDYFGVADLVDGDGNNMGHHYIQVGWSQYSHGVCESQTDYENWVIGAKTTGTGDTGGTGDAGDAGAVVAAVDAGDTGDTGDSNGYWDKDGKYYRFIYDSRFENAYAVWALDENENGTADFMEGGNNQGSSGSSSGSSRRKTTSKTPADVSSTVCDGGVNCPSRQFTDLNTSAWYHEYTDYVVTHDLMNGTGASIFAPNADTNRAMVVTVLYRLEGEPAVTRNIPFADVAAGKWYSNAINWASTNGIVTGYDENTFGPDDPITREQLAAILYRYADYKGYDVAGRAVLSGYTDAPKVREYAVPPMQWAVDAGLIEGTTATTLAPQGSAVRVQVAAILARFCESIAK